MANVSIAMLPVKSAADQELTSAQLASQDFICMIVNGAFPNVLFLRQVQQMDA